MLSVNNMLNENQYKRPSVLDISSLLNTSDDHQQKSPSLSPSLTSSPASISSYTSYPFPVQTSEPLLWDDAKKHNNRLKSQRRESYTPISMNEDDVNMLDEEDEESPGEEVDDEDDSDSPVKAKRRRANAKQLEVLNRVFDRTFFPSTQMRAELGRQLGMSPRTVQIWFQNRRQAMRTRERQRLVRLRNSETKSTATK
ncbi:hypothetical protein [Parasitella parasitica]|uniref:Homeobox domain-containing protein n=1 Tax=Parasitella parasitica TaxID=35722 RepID=A0A0B7N588_9FUNG|nr:hypothetical protein [Parasitella parasitica]